MFEAVGVPGAVGGVAAAVVTVIDGDAGPATPVLSMALTETVYVVDGARPSTVADRAEVATTVGSPLPESTTRLYPSSGFVPAVAAVQEKLADVRPTADAVGLPGAPGGFGAGRVVIATVPEAADAVPAVSIALT